MEIDDIIKDLHSITDDYQQTPNTSVLDSYHRHYPITISEGLIKTYPSESVVAIMSQLFDLSGGSTGYGGNGRIKLRRRDSGLDGVSEDTIFITLKTEAKHLLKQVNNHMLKYGWFLGEQENGVNCVMLSYEKKFGDRYSAEDLAKKSGDRFIYHITSSKIADKIRRQGFVPKTHTDYLIDDEAFTTQPEEANRVYFFVERPSDFDVTSWGSVAASRTGGAPVLITVDPSAINKNVSFFMDPRWKRGVFTYEPIPSYAIVSIEELEE